MCGAAVNDNAHVDYMYKLHITMSLRRFFQHYYSIAPAPVFLKESRPFLIFSPFLVHMKEEVSSKENGNK